MAGDTNRKNEQLDEPEMRKEYDFSKGECGKYAELAKDGSNVIRLDPDVAAVFHDSKQVNDFLRSIVRLIKESGRDSGS